MFFLGLLLGPPVATAEGVVDPHRVQTAFIYQFTNYIEWPAAAKAGDAFAITVVGRSPITAELESLATSKTAQGRPVRIRQVPDASALEKSHVIYVAAEDEEVLKEVLKRSQGTHALVITAGKGLAEKGAMVNFFVSDGRVRFQINRGAVKNADLKVGSQLLKYAELIE